MYPTVAEVLALPVLRQGGPRIVAGGSGTGRRVRWAHAVEVSDIAHLLKGGELVLTTGIALPDDPQALTVYIDDLAAVGACGLIVEMVRHWNDTLPEAMLAAANRHGLPLVTLSRETRYVTVTETVNAMIVDAQVNELRAAEQVHQSFTELTVAGAGPPAVLAEVARMTLRPVVLETLSHEVLAYDAADTDPVELLDGWRTRSRAVRLGERTGYQEEAGWLLTVIGSRGRDWGRLIILSGERPPRRHVVVAERAASALAVHRLLGREGDTLERQAHQAVLAELTESPAPSAELLTRSVALGVPLTGRRLVGAALRPVFTGAAPTGSVSGLLRDLADSVVFTARRARVDALVGVVDETTVRVLLSLSPQANVDAVLGRLAAAVRRPQRPCEVLVAAGSVVPSPAESGRSLLEAAQVAVSGGHGEPTPARGFHRLDDVRLRGLLGLFGDDERLRAFAERELGPLFARDAAAGTRLVPALRHYCEHGGNKSAAAAAAHTSRTAYYQQLARIEQVLGVPLEDPESMLSLYVALLVLDVGGDEDTSELHPHE